MYSPSSIITEISLKMALNTINQPPSSENGHTCCTFQKLAIFLFFPKISSKKSQNSQVVNFHGSESLSNFQVRKYIGNGYIMNLVVLIVPFIVYCVIMYVYKLNKRDKI
jgi:hypothetical protein